MDKEEVKEKPKKKKGLKILISLLILGFVVFGASHLLHGKTIIFGNIVYTFGGNNDPFDEDVYINAIPSPKNFFSYNDSYVSCDTENNCSIGIKKKGLWLYQVSSTHSMNPAIPDASKIIIADIPENYNFTLGDIVCFYSKATNNLIEICHRIIKIDGDNVLTKGDNDKIEDGWIPKSDIKGIIVGVLY